MADMTLRKAREILRAVDVVIRRTDYGEYRVCVRGCGEESAYYTNDLEDAVDTGRMMAGVS